MTPLGRRALLHPLRHLRIPWRGLVLHRSTPSHIHSWSLAGGNSAALRLCLHYLETMRDSSCVSIRHEIGSISCDCFLSHIVLILLIRFIRYTRVSISNSVVLRPDSLSNPSKTLSIRSLDIVAFTQDNCHIHDEARASSFPQDVTRRINDIR